MITLRAAAGPLYSQDRILQAMGNVTLALHLLCERASPSSPWLPYVKSLPGDYDTPLYYEEEEVRHLLGTQAVQDVLSQYKNTARQYAYFYKVVQVRGDTHARTHTHAIRFYIAMRFTIYHLCQNSQTLNISEGCDCFL